ncbi:MAG: hypothetical protein E2598_06470 [Sphingobium sp.]|nr:hypothetical protein [Sphingobium sp.]
MKSWQAMALMSAGAVFASSWFFQDGKKAGFQKAAAQYEAKLKKAEAETAEKSATIEAMATTAMLADQGREATHREIIRETSKIIDRPVYLDSCVDVDGLLILDRLAANANGEDPAASVGRAAAPAQSAANE